jgi:hypothetical protein
LFALVLQVSPSLAADATGPVVGTPVQPNVLRRLGDLPPVDPAKEPAPAIDIPEGNPLDDVRPPLVPPSGSGTQDPAIQKGPIKRQNNDGSGVTPRAIGIESHADFSPIRNFNGINSGFNVPDTIGDVGPNHYVQMINSQFAIFNKTTGAIVPGGGPFNISQVWTNAGDTGQCSQFNRGDPVVLHDHLADRWLLSQFAFPLDGGGNPIAPFDMCVAISQTGDPTGAYNVYTFRIPTDQPTFADYPKFGVWPDAYYMSSYEGNRLGAYAFDRVNMLAGNAAGFQQFQIPDPTTDNANVRDSRVLPSDLDGAAPPGGSPNFFLRTVEAAQDNTTALDRLELWEFVVDWNVPANSSVTLVQTITEGAGLAGYALLPCFEGGGGFRDCIPQPNGTQFLDGLSNRPMWRLQYRNFGTHEALVTNQTVDADGNGNAGIRWYELRRNAGDANWTIRQQSTYAPQAPGVNDTTWVHRWMGSIAMDKFGNMALGYSVANGDAANPVFPGIRYAGRLGSDPLSGLPQAEQTLINGAADKLGNQRWGDYSSMNVDPVDDCTFWYTTEYTVAAAQQNWRTRIGSFKFAGCNLPPVANAGPDQTLECTGGGGASVMLNGTGSSDPDGDPLTYTWTGPFGVANGPTPVVNLPVGVHVVTLTVDDGHEGTAMDTVTITVVDTTPPTIHSVTATPGSLWPPNHKMVGVSLTVSVTDVCHGSASCQIVSVSSNEPENGLGDGDTAPDWTITGDLTVNLRAERSGNGSGRVYTITVQCTDASGNSATKSVNVTVPHSKGNN